MQRVRALADISRRRRIIGSCPARTFRGRRAPTLPSNHTPAQPTLLNSVSSVCVRVRALIRMSALRLVSHAPGSFDTRNFNMPPPIHPPYGAGAGRPGPPYADHAPPPRQYGAAGGRGDFGPNGPGAPQFGGGPPPPQVPLPHLHRDWGSPPVPHLHRDWGVSHLHRDWGSPPVPHLHRDWGSPPVPHLHRDCRSGLRRMFSSTSTRLHHLI